MATRQSRRFATQDGAAHLLQARVEYALVGDRLAGTVRFPGRPPRHFEDVSELQAYLEQGGSQLTLVKAQDAEGESMEGLAALTPNERAIARGALSGSSNQEIAESLYYSVKSIEAYLTRIYRRLGVRGREELATVLAADDLEPPDTQADLVAGGTATAGPPARASVPRATVELLLA